MKFQRGRRILRKGKRTRVESILSWGWSPSHDCKSVFYERLLRGVVYRFSRFGLLQRLRSNYGYQRIWSTPDQCRTRAGARTLRCNEDSDHNTTDYTLTIPRRLGHVPRRATAIYDELRWRQTRWRWQRVWRHVKIRNSDKAQWQRSLQHVTRTLLINRCTTDTHDRDSTRAYG